MVRVLKKDEKNYVTPMGLNALRNELRALLNEERPKVVETVAWAASNGDRSENGDYIYGKKRLREIDRRIKYLKEQIEDAILVDHKGKEMDRVLFGTKVTVLDEEGIEKTFYIVGIDEAEPEIGKISWVSPLAKALLQKKIGDVAYIKTPKEDREYEILSINPTTT